MLGKGIIEQTGYDEGQFVLNVFLRPKQNGEFRLILDLTDFNKSVVYEHFKMTSLQTAIDSLRPGAWMGSVDLKDAYYSVPVAESDRKFLKLAWNGNLYQFRVIPNGLSCAPRVFTKIMKPIFATLAEEGYECFPYIDDSFIISDSKEKCQEAIFELCRQMDRLGFVVHEGKSSLEPSQELVFLGFWLDSNSMTISLTEAKRAKFERAAAELVEKSEARIREVAGLVGLVTANEPAVEYGGSHIKLLEVEKNKK